MILRTFASEDDRKTKLFAAWTEYLCQMHTRYQYENGDPWNFEVIYEGSAHIQSKSKNQLNLHLESGERIRYLDVTTQISRLSCPMDMVFVVMGKHQEKWWPLDIISIGSFLDFKRDQFQNFHLTFNPNLIEWLPEIGGSSENIQNTRISH